MGEETEETEEKSLVDEFEADGDDINLDDINLDDSDEDDADSDAEAEDKRPKRGSSSNKRDDLLPADPEQAIKANPKRAKKHQKRTRIIEGVLDTASLDTPEGTEKAWIALQKQVGDAKKRKYKMSEDFTENDVINHAKFGEGYVVEIVTRTKIAVLFEDGMKKLAQNKG